MRHCLLVAAVLLGPGLGKDVRGQAPVVGEPHRATDRLLIDSLAAHRKPERLMVTAAANSRAFPPGVPRGACLAIPWPDQDERDAIRAKRARFALWGLVIGAGIGWITYDRACRASECFSPEGGILLAAAGGVAGMLVGLLLGPAP